MSTSPFSPSETLSVFTHPLYYQSQSRRTVETYAFDQSYLERLAADDPATTDHFVLYFQKLVFIKMRFKLRDANLAEDVAQETLLRVLHHVKKHGGIHNPEKFGAFVNRVSENICRETRRQSERFRQVPENAPDPIERRLGAEQHTITDEQKRIVLAELKKLSKKDQNILRKVFLLEQDKDAICQEEGIDRNYLRVQVHRALGRFRKLLDIDLPRPARANRKAAAS